MALCGSEVQSGGMRWRELEGNAGNVVGGAINYMWQKSSMESDTIMPSDYGLWMGKKLFMAQFTARLNIFPLLFILFFFFICSLIIRYSPRFSLSIYLSYFHHCACGFLFTIT